jgi:thiol:disulfide interchange protein DsbD
MIPALLALLLLAPQDPPTLTGRPAKPKPQVKAGAVRVQADEVRAGETVRVAVDLEIPAGFHIYPMAKTTTGKPTTLTVEGAEVVPPFREPETKTHKEAGLDPYEYHEGKITLTVGVKLPAALTAGRHELKSRAAYQICDENNCFDNQTAFTIPLEVAPGAAAPSASTSSAVPEGGALKLILLGMLGGLISLVMPCTYPLIPITLTYFVKQAAGSRAHGLFLSSLYSLGIILTFTGLGFGMSVLLGAGGARTFAANPWVNIVVAALFFWFAGSLFGWYEIALPFGLGTRLAGSSQRKGAGGAFLLGLLFSVVTFTCTIPIAGTILGFAAGDHRFAALFAMLAYSVTMAVPFFLMGLFPGMIKEVPKAGGWMTTVKVSMGFVETALALFYLSKVDQSWDFGILNRWVILGVYVLTCGVVAAYLVKSGRTALRLASAALFLGLGGFLAYGFTGAPLGGAEAIIPPPPIHSTTMPKAMAEALSKKRPLFAEFTGVT